MHPAWLIDDIWRLLLEHLLPRDLAVLAQTCNALHDLATAALWHTVTDFKGLLQCLPKDYRHRSLQLEDLKRLDFYSAKIQVLSLEGESVSRPLRLPHPYQIHKNQKQYKENEGKAWDELWEEIARLRPQSAFLSNVKKVRINNADEQHICPLIGISGFRLEHVYIKYIHQRQSPSLVPKFLGTLQDITKLEYLFVRDGQDLIPSKILLEAPLKHIRFDPRISGGWHMNFHFKVFPIRPELLSKDTLQHLTISLTREWYTSQLKLGERKLFPNLKTLWLNLTTLESKAYSQHSPVEFLDALDQPELDLLNIKFRYDATGRQFLDVVKAAKRSCRLENLTELALAGGGWFENCMECGSRPAPSIQPVELREALKVVLPLPNLKVLRVSVAPNLLDILDLDLYEEIAKQMPLLERLHLGHAEFYTSSLFYGTVIYERVPLHHLAAFCHLFSEMEEVSVGTVDGKLLEEYPNKEWRCPNVKRVQWDWEGLYDIDGLNEAWMREGLSTYFPKSDMASALVERYLTELRVTAEDV
ncbi:hypothetical protein BDV96DRAFT_577885 [Lophiotrema nucula]|uniref:F-box domain-containing protein n=1 Tax=Lophiotrema nucula TaxID=690887 RepID=A0A6A5Z4D8_9PLEO|nr:hypothetical protein BDV96DRAFT_577885 [Lophiotrema nucula]